VEEVLKKGKHSVVAAEDWAEARNAFKTNDPFHVILVDVNLPGMRSGDHLANSLRMHPKAKESKIVFFSAESDEHLEKLTNMSGMDGYITKGQGDEKFLKDVEAYMPPEAFDAASPTARSAVRSAPKPASTPKKKSWWKK
jgi:CheY-like chemotaxis protein